MPALLRGSADDGGGDLIGVKWIVGFPDNPAVGLPTYHAQVILSDSRNRATPGDPGRRRDHRPANGSRQRSCNQALRAAASGAGRRVAILGAGVQARGHLPVIGRLLPGGSVRVADVDQGRAEALAVEARSIEGIGDAAALRASARRWKARTWSSRSSRSGRIIRLSIRAGSPPIRSSSPSTTTLQAPAALARKALFVVDERDQFLATRAGGGFAGYPDPAATLGEALREGSPAPPAWSSCRTWASARGRRLRVGDTEASRRARHWCAARAAEAGRASRHLGAERFGSLPCHRISAQSGTRRQQGCGRQSCRR